MSASADESNKKRQRSESPSNSTSDAAGGANEDTSGSGSGKKRANIDGTPTVTSPRGDTLMKDVSAGANLPAVPPPPPPPAKTTLVAPPEAGLPAKVESAQPEAAVPVKDQSIVLKALIVTDHAGIIIGKAGISVREIREKSNARINVSKEVVGNPERVMSVEGQLDAVAKAFGLFVRKINKEPFDVPSVPGSRDFTVHLIIPNSRMGMIIGKGGSKLKEIQEASGARLNPREEPLPQSTERVLDVSGVADAIHIATYYIGVVLLTPSLRGGSGIVGGGGGDRMGHSQQSHHQPYGQARPPAAPTAAQQAILSDPNSRNQDIFVPAQFMGGLIGAKGATINEIRNSTYTVIKIPEVGEAGTVQPPNPSDRLVTITGHPTNIAQAVEKIFDRLAMEKKRAEDNAAGLGRDPRRSAPRV